MMNDWEYCNLAFLLHNRAAYCRLKKLDINFVGAYRQLDAMVDLRLLSVCDDEWREVLNVPVEEWHFINEFKK